MNDEHDFAFPQHWQDNDGNGGGYFGLTKREYFAGLAMQGMLAGMWTDDCLADYDGDLAAFLENQEILAQSAASYADALILALNTEQQP